MKPFGEFLSNLRNSSKLSLHELALLVNSSKSTLSRLENNAIPRPFKTAIRSLIIELAEILCTSKQEVERYLSLASIDTNLLTESERIQLGFISHVDSSAFNEPQNLERFERMYDKRIQELQHRTALIRKVPPHLERKIQDYVNILEEIRKKTYTHSDGQFPIPLAQQPWIHNELSAEEGYLLILNFNHPLTEQQKGQIETLAKRAIGEIIAIPTQIEESESIAPQIARLVDSIGLTLEDWHRHDIFINPPGYSIVASILLAEIHGRIGHFPTLIRLRPKHDVVTNYEVVELLNLQSVRELARLVSNGGKKSHDPVNNITA